jgi:tetratricopeptide (TPR) repeat protein
VVQNKQKIGPLSVEELQKLSQGGSLKPEDMVLQDGSRTWVPAASVAGLFESHTVAPSQGVVIAPPVARPASADTLPEVKGAGTVNVAANLGTVTAPPHVAIPVPRSFPNGPRGAVPVPELPGYEIIEELGRGGMGVVYKARQTTLKRLVALKMILSGGYASSAELMRFLAEAQAVARLQHQNIVQIHEIGEKDSLPFFSLEFVAGGTLAKRLAGTPLIARDAAQLTATIALAIEAAHQAGIVHRDLKPANVLLAGDASTPLNQCVPKVADFGLAKTLGDDSGQTRTGVVMGTPSYMSPEQASGLTKDIGPRTDVYALGAMLYEMLTGRPPFRAATAMETMGQVRTQEPVSPRTLQPSVPRDLETICLKCLAKDREGRYATAKEVAEDLERFLSNKPILARPASPWERTVKFVKRNRLVVGAASAIFFLMLITVILTTASAARASAAQQREEIKRQEAERKNHELLLASAEIARKGGELRERLRILKKALEAGHPNRLMLKMEMARTHAALTEPDEARKILDEMEAEGDLGEYAGSVMLLRGYQTMGNRIKEAYNLIEKALRQKLPPVEEAFARGLLAATSDDAIKFFKQAIEIDSRHEPSRSMLGVMLFTLGRMEEADELLRGSLILYPDNPNFRMLRAMILARNGRKKEALQLLERTKKQIGKVNYEILLSLMDFMEAGGRIDDPDRETTPEELASMWAKLAPQVYRIWPIGMKEVSALPEEGASVLMQTPPVLNRSLSEVILLFGQLLQDVRTDTTTTKLDLALRAHPEGTLMFFHGIMLHGQKKYREARLQFHSSARAPSVVRIRRWALLLALTCETELAIDKGKVIDAEMLKNSVATIKQLITEGAIRPHESGMILKVLVAAKEYDWVRVLIGRLNDVGLGDHPEVVRASMTAYSGSGEHFMALQIANSVLKQDPKNAEALRVRSVALGAIKKIAGENN